jgi:pilus assembly protein CpaB
VQEAAAAPAPPAVKISILVAARPQRAGDLMVAEDVTTSEVPAGREPAGSLIDSVAARTALRGAMIRRSLAENEPILAGDVLNAGDRGFLAAVLGLGMRAVTVAVDAVSGTAGLIWPGDRVDLVLTQQIDDRDRPADRRVSGETVLTNLRVIAVDQQLVQGGQSGQPAAANGNRTVTIEASLYDTQRIAVASRLGRIALVVRSAADNQQAAATETPASQPPIAWAGDVSPALREHKTSGRSGASIHLYHGPGTVDEIRF